MEGPSDFGASMAMGNSPSMWDRVYDRSFRRREMQAAVDAMSVWRQGAVGEQTVAAVADVMPLAHEDEDIDVDIDFSDA